MLSGSLGLLMSGSTMCSAVSGFSGARPSSVSSKSRSFRKRGSKSDCEPSPSGPLLSAGSPMASSIRSRAASGSNSSRSMDQ